MKNKITSEEIDKIIAEGKLHIYTVGEKTTVAFFKTKEGFEMFATSSCVDPKNYSKEIGKENCLKQIKDKLWELEGYCLQKDLYAEKNLKKDITLQLKKENKNIKDTNSSISKNANIIGSALEDTVDKKIKETTENLSDYYVYSNKKVHTLGPNNYLIESVKGNSKEEVTEYKTEKYTITMLYNKQKETYTVSYAKKGEKPVILCKDEEDFVKVLSLTKEMLNK